jgi:hypothetical protein
MGGVRVKEIGDRRNRREEPEFRRQNMMVQYSGSEYP